MTETTGIKELYLLRHGIAVEPGTPGYPSDAARALTSEGKYNMKKIAGAMRTMALEFDLILSSPYVRARQTAEIVRETLKLSTEIIFTDNLVLRADSKNLIREINANYSHKRSLLLVGHEPFLSMLISKLISGSTDCPIEMKKGGLCKLTASDLKYGRCAVLQWLLAPSQLVSLC